MTAALDRALLAEVSTHIAERMGLHFPEERWPDLARALVSAARELGFDHLDAFICSLRTRGLTSRQIETLGCHLTVGETYFFRDPLTFEVLERDILPALDAARAETGRALRLWSAGCCTGEEAYSIAISCARVLTDLRPSNVSILATDISPRFLAKAEAGVFSEWSFRGTPDWLRGGFFCPAPDKKLAVTRIMKDLVHFGYLNLAEDIYPSLHNHTNAMDVIFCRNVLMYFTPDHQRRVVAALHRCLVDGGYLVVNPAEASASLFPMFTVENIGGVTLYRKAAQPTRADTLPGLVSPVPAPVAPAPAAPPIMPITSSPCDELLVLARSHANQGRLEEALSSCQGAIEAEHTNAAAHFLYATICHELGRLGDAITALGKVLYLDQDFILAHHALGGLYKRLGKQRESGRHFAVALQLLSARKRDEIVPDSDGMTCGRLVESVQAMTGT